jgi:Protein of unknown function (DUF3099)
MSCIVSGQIRGGRGCRLRLPGAGGAVSIVGMTPADGRDRRADELALITDAAPSLDDDLARRRRVYLRIMVVHIVGFALSYPLYLWQWWAGALAVLLTGLLPWVAVLLANDRPRRERRDPARVPPRGIR